MRTPSRLGRRAPRNIGLILAVLASAAIAQSPNYCSDITNRAADREPVCSACAGVVSTQDGVCAWQVCDYGYSSTGASCVRAASASSYYSCSSSASYTIVNSTAQCPSPVPSPTPLEFAWTRAPTWGLVGIGGVASIALGALVYSPMERLTGTPPSPAPAPYVLVHALSFASASLWFGASTLLAAPTVPWIITSEPAKPGFTTAFYYYVTAFDFIACNVDVVKKLVAYCNQYKPDYLVKYPNPLASQYAGAMTAATRGGISAYVFVVCTLFPAAIISGIAAYRLKNLLRHGIPAYTAGCSSANLVTALVLAAIGSVASIALVGTAFSLAQTASEAPLFNKATMTGLPGQVAGGLSAALSSLGAVLLGVALSSLHAMPGFGMSACRRDAPALPITWSPNPVAAELAPAAATNEKPPKDRSLPPGWRRHGPDDNGDVWYSTPDGGTTWEPPRM
jgi:hypothetical protein